MDNMGKRIKLKPDVEKILFDKEEEMVREYLKNSDHRHAECVLEKIENLDVIILNKVDKIEIYDKHAELLATINDIQLCQKIFEFYKEITGKNFTQIYDRDFNIGECIVKIIELFIDLDQYEKQAKIKVIKEILLCPGDEDCPDVEPQNPPPPGDDPEHQIVLPPRDV